MIYDNEVTEVEVFEKANEDVTKFFPESNSLLIRLNDLEYILMNIENQDNAPYTNNLKDLLVDNIIKEIDFIKLQLKTLDTQPSEEK